MTLDNNPRHQGNYCLDPHFKDILRHIIYFCACAVAHMCMGRSEGNSWGWLSPSNALSPKGQTQVIKFSSKCLYPSEPSCWPHGFVLLFIPCVWVFCVHVWLCTSRTQCSGCQKMLDAPELELWTAVSRHQGARNGTIRVPGWNKVFCA